MPDPDRIEYDPPRRVQLRGYLGDWIDAIQHLWRWDKLRGEWRATVTVEVSARDLRQWRGGAAAHRPDGHNHAARRPKQQPPYKN